MGHIRFLFLSQEEIISLNISWKEIIDRVELALKEHGEKSVENPPKPGVHSKSNSFIHAMPSYLKKMNTLGLKWVSGYPDNHRFDLPSISGVLILNCPETGKVLSIMDCRWITAVRTAAVTAISAKKLAKENPTNLGIVGAGVQGRMNFAVLEKYLPSLKTCKIYDIRKESLDSFLDKIGQKSKIAIKVAASAEEAVRDSDIIITCTQKLSKPILKYEWLKEGVLAIPLESSRAWESEALFQMEKFIIDDLEQGKLYKQGGAFPGGIPKLYAETGEVVAGIKNGRENNQEKIMVMNIGLACEDISLGTYIYEKALENGKGIEISLMEKENFPLPM